MIERYAIAAHAGGRYRYAVVDLYRRRLIYQSDSLDACRAMAERVTEMDDAMLDLPEIPEVIEVWFQQARIRWPP